jgi:hypothetical protein
MVAQKVVNLHTNVLVVENALKGKNEIIIKKKTFKT